MKTRSGISSIIGTVFFITAALATLGVLATLYSMNVQTQLAGQNAASLQSFHAKESLAYHALSNGTLAVGNTGSSSSSLALFILKFANGTVYEFAPNHALASGGLLSVPSLIAPSNTCGGSTCLSKYTSILGSTNAGDSIGLVTSLGNTFWVKPAEAVLTSNPGTTYPVTFDASGDSAFGGAPVLTVDTTTFITSQLPVTLTWFAGTTHSYSYQTLPQGSGTRVGVSSVSGLSSSTSGTITATSTGTIRASYTSQYLLTVSGGSGVVLTPSSPTNDGYYNGGTSVQATTNYVWSTTAGQSRQNLYSWQVDGATPTTVTRSASGAFMSSGVTMNAPHTVQFNSVQQFYLTSSGGNGITYSASPTADTWYDSGTTATVTSNYVWNSVAGQSRQNLKSYNVDGGSNASIARANSGAFTTSIAMNGYHTVNFNAVTQYYLTLSTSVPSGTVPAISVSDSYTAATTSVLQSGGCSIDRYRGNSCSVALSSSVTTHSTGLLIVQAWSMYFGGSACATISVSDTLGSTWLADSDACGGASTRIQILHAVAASNSGDTITCSASYSLTSVSCSVSEVYGASTTISSSGNTNFCTINPYNFNCSPSVSAISWPTGAYVINPFATQCGGNCANFGFSPIAPTIPSSSNGFTFPYNLNICPGTSCDSYNADWGETDIYSEEIGFAANPLTLSTSSSVTTSSSTYSVSGGTATYSYAFSNTFPAGAASRQFVFTVPSTETYSSISCGSPAVSGQTVTISDGDIGTCNGSFTISTTRSGTFSASQSGSPTGDSWYDAGGSATVTSSGSGPFSFGNWSGSSTIANTTQATTTVTMNGFYTVAAAFNVNP